MKTNQRILTVTDYDGSVHLNQLGKGGGYPSASESECLTRLSKNPNTPVVVITGRDHARAREIFKQQLSDPLLRFCLFSDSGGSKNASMKNGVGDPVSVGPRLEATVQNLAQEAATKFLEQYNSCRNKPVTLEFAPENTSFFIRIQDPHVFSESGVEQHNFMVDLKRNVSEAIQQNGLHQSLHVQLGNDELAVKSFSKEMILENTHQYLEGTGIDSSQFSTISYTGDEANDEGAYIATNNLREKGVVTATYRVCNCSSHFLDKKPNSPNQPTNASFYLIGGPSQHIMYDVDMAATIATHQEIDLELKKVGLHKPGETPLVLLDTASRKDVLVQNVTCEQTNESSFNKTLNKWDFGKLVLCADSSKVAVEILKAAKENSNILVVDKERKMIYQAGKEKPLVSSIEFGAACNAAKLPPYRLFTDTVAELNFVKGVQGSLYNKGIVKRRVVQIDMSAFAKPQLVDDLQVGSQTRTIPYASRRPRGGVPKGVSRGVSFP